MKRFILIFGLMAWISTSLLAQQDEGQIQRLVQQRNFVVHIDRAYPMSGHDTSIFNPRGEIVVADSTVRGELPFFGRAYRASFSNSGGLQFDAPLRNVSFRVKKKSKIVYFGFEVRSKEGDILHFNLQISPSGTCDVNMVSNTRSPISYSGYVEAVEEAGKD